MVHLQHTALLAEGPGECWPRTTGPVEGRKLEPGRIHHICACVRVCVASIECAA